MALDADQEQTLPEKKANGRALRSAKNKSNIGNKKTSENDGGTEVVNEPSSKAPRSENSGKKDTKRKASAIDEDDANSKDGDYDKPQYKRNRVVLPDDAYDLDITDDEDQHKDGKQGDVLTKEPKKPSKGQKAAANTKVGAKKGRSAANASATKKAAPAKGKEKSNANDEPQVEREDKIKAKSNFKTALKKEAEALDPAPLKIRVGVFSLDVAAQGFRDLGWSNMSEQDIAASKLQTHDHLPVSR